MSNQDLQIVNVTDTNRLASFEKGWNRLLLKDIRPVPMSSYAWMSGFFQHRLKPSEKWACLMATKDQKLVGVLPLVCTYGTRLGRPYPRICCPFDSHTYSVDICVDPEYASEVIPALLTGLEKAFPGWCQLLIRRVADTSQSVRFIPNGLHQVATINELCDFESVIHTTGSYEDYQSLLSKNFRRALTKAIHRHEKIEGLSYISYKGSDCLDGFQKLIEVDAASWRANKGDDLLSRPRLLQAHQNALELMIGTGWPRINLLIKNHLPIAAQFAFQLGTNLIVKIVTHREDHSHLSPGNMLFRYLIQQAFEDSDILLVNCLTEMPWHRNWKMQSRPNCHLWIFSRRWVPLLTRYGYMRTKQIAHYIPGLARLVRWYRKKFR